MKGSSGKHSLAQIVDALRNTPILNFHDEFNRAEEDTDVWTKGADGAGAFAFAQTAGGPTTWQIYTGNVIDNDTYIHGQGVIKNKYFTPNENGFTTVTFEARLQNTSIADISVLLGLLSAPITDYAEPAADCAHFIIDPAISATYRARSWGAAEEETDTLIALDTAMHVFKIVWTATSVAFYIDGVLVATHVTQIPDLQMIIEFLIRTEAAAAKYMRLDSVKVEVT